MHLYIIYFHIITIIIIIIIIITKGVQYIGSWLEGTGAAAINNLMEDMVIH